MIKEYSYPLAEEVNPILKSLILTYNDKSLGKPTEATCLMTEWDLHQRSQEALSLIRWIGKRIDEDFVGRETKKFAEMWGVHYINDGEEIDWHNHFPDQLRLMNSNSRDTPTPMVGNYSFAYYVTVPDGSAPLIFREPNLKFEPKQGNVVIFNSDLDHKVPPNYSKGRIAISGNILLTEHPSIISSHDIT